MTNCVHPTILYEALSQPFNRNEFVYTRFSGIQSNASPLSYEELDGAKDLKTSAPMGTVTTRLSLLPRMAAKE